MQVTVFGLGRVGCVTATGLARLGHHVFALAPSQECADALNAGCAPILEPGLDEALTEVVRSGRFVATTRLDEIRNSDVVLICLPTSGEENTQAGVELIREAGEQIGERLIGRTRHVTVVLRSSVSPGTTDSVLRPALRRGSRGTAQINVAVNPAFLREGSAVKDFQRAPFVLVGCDDLATGALVRDLYAGLNAPFIETSTRMTELVRCAASAYASLEMSFAHELAGLCDALRLNGRDVMRILARSHAPNLVDAYLRQNSDSDADLQEQARSLLNVAVAQGVDGPIMTAIASATEHRVSAVARSVLRTAKHRVGIVSSTCRGRSDARTGGRFNALPGMLAEQGCDVQIFSREGRRALRRASRAVAVSDNLDDFLEHAEVLVVTEPTRDSARLLGLVDPECIVIDLTHGAAWNPGGRAASERDRAVGQRQPDVTRIAAGGRK